MPISVFIDKESIPTEKELQEILGDTYSIWTTIRSEALKLENFEKEGWHFSGQKHGWNYRISDKKRVLIYLLPRKGYFKVAFVFGEKAVEKIKESAINPKIIEELLAAKKYAEGRGIRIDVKEKRVLKDILKLLEIKVEK